MTDTASSSNSSVSVISIPTTLTIDLASGFNMQSIYESIISQNSSSTYTILGIDIPLIGIDCLQYKTVDPTFDIKEAVQRLFEYLMKLVAKPIWTVLETLASVLGAVVDGILEIPVLGLKITDLFREDLPEVIAKIVRTLWETGKNELENLLRLLDIPWPWFENVDDPELSIRKIAKDIASSLWQFFFKAIGKLLAAIKIALLAFDIATYETPNWSLIWDKAIDAIVSSIAKFLAFPITLEELYKAIIDFAKSVFDLPIITAKEIIEIIEKFKLPIFGLPMDWKLPLNIKVEFPEKDFSKIISDMLSWLNNFLVGILKKFIEAIGAILNFFGIPFKFLTEINIPIVVCAVENQ
jgi:hypothetical protein